MPIMDNHNKKFACWIIFLPGVKTVRLLGIVKNYPSSESVRPIKRSSKESSVASKQPGKSRDLEQENSDRLKLLQMEVAALNGLLKGELEDSKKFLAKNEIRKLKSRWVHSNYYQALSLEQINNNAILYNRIETEK
ncbi:hypothetical protein HPULCUR_001654 [Helicostylum pulchrum]|uniref:Uncharacterized protein n=1 Tax=Helicostylum pulchrum TaxID=562976 RepID=A0ABP9XNB6_9FUNG